MGYSLKGHKKSYMTEQLTRSYMPRPPGQGPELRPGDPGRCAEQAPTSPLRCRTSWTA